MGFFCPYLFVFFRFPIFDSFHLLNCLMICCFAKKHHETQGCMNYLYTYIHIYCHPQTHCFVLSELFSVARHAGRSKTGSKPVQLFVRLSFRPLGHQALAKGILRYLFYINTLFTFFIPYRLPECSILFSKSFALR